MMAKVRFIRTLCTNKSLTEEMFTEHLLCAPWPDREQGKAEIQYLLSQS